MVRKPINPMTPAEWKIMNILWEKKSAAFGDIYDVAGELYEWSPSTVKTLLSRLTAKGFIKTTQVGRSYLYKPARPALKTLFTAADALLANAMQGTNGPLLCYMMKNSRLSEEEIDEIQSLLDDYRSQKEK